MSDNRKAVLPDGRVIDIDSIDRVYEVDKACCIKIEGIDRKGEPRVWTIGFDSEGEALDFRNIIIEIIEGYK